MPLILCGRGGGGPGALVPHGGADAPSPPGPASAHGGCPLPNHRGRRHDHAPGGAAVTWTPLRPSTADLAREARDVVADLPRFLTAPLLRPWHRSWGASKGEAEALAVPGDDVFPDVQYRCTR